MEANYKKVTQALNWLARKEGGSINKMKAIKLVWLVDRLHLREYGRPVTNDDYVAMKFGPVGSITRNITDEAIPYLTDEQYGYSRNYIKKISDNFFSSTNDVDVSVFSESEIVTLEKIYKEFGKFDQYELRDLTHEYPEWKRFEPKIEAGQINQAPMSYSDFFENPAETSELLNGKFQAATEIFNQSQTEIEIAKQAFVELQEIYGLWS
jgi:uncharacterized phage-associated protein